MNDTVSAATAWGSGDARLNFLDVGDYGAAPGPVGSHISGSAYSVDAAPGLIVNFVSLSPDASGWGSVIGLDQAAAPLEALPPTVSGFASMPDTSSPVIVGALSSS
jgi:hypothetical protein